MDKQARRREQSKLRMRAKRAADPEKYRAMVRAWRKTAKGKKVVADWVAKNREHLEKMRRVYRGLPAPTRPKPGHCECCGCAPTKRGLHLDHRHDTGEFRGWLCQRCNHGIGSLGDNLPGVLRAVAYLLKPGG